MDITTLKRDPSKILDCIEKMPDNTVMVTKPVKLYIPKRFEESNLAVISGEVTVLGIFAVVVDDKFYSVFSVNAMIRIQPSNTNTVKIDDADYYEFDFDAGSTLIANTQAVKSKTLPYYIYNEFIAKGRVPWYMDMDDMCKLFDTSVKHAGVNLGNNHAIIEMIVSVLARNPENMTQYYRHDSGNIPKPEFIPFRSVTYGATNTTSKLMGSNYDDGLDSGLVNPSTQVEKVEELLRT